MPFDTSHLYLTINWGDNREPLEGGQVGIRFTWAGTEVTQAMVDAAKAPVQTFWQSTGALIPSSYSLKYLRLAVIGTDGHYLPNTFSRDGIYTSPVGTANATVYHPLQVASVATFKTDRPSGVASRGRVYLPPLAAAIGNDGRWSAAVCDARADALGTLLTSLNGLAAFGGAGGQPFAAVFSKGTSKAPAGVHSFIRGVTVGTRPDVQRRRAKNMLEKYGAVKAVTGAAVSVP